MIVGRQTVCWPLATGPNAGGALELLAIRLSSCPAIQLYSSSGQDLMHLAWNGLNGPAEGSET